MFLSCGMRTKIKSTTLVTKSVCEALVPTCDLYTVTSFNFLFKRDESVRRQLLILSLQLEFQLQLLTGLSELSPRYQKCFDTKLK